MNAFVVKQSIVRTICHPAVSILIRTLFRGRIPSRGFRINTNNKSVPLRNVAQLFWGLYEKTEINFVRQFLHRDLDVVELGASLGVVSLHIQRSQAHGRRLICVEPNPFLIDSIYRNHKTNASGTDILVLNGAIDYTGRKHVNFIVNEDNLSSRIDGTKGQEIAVRSITLKEIVREHELEEFALVCDIEGAEAGLIFKDAEALARCRQVIIELHRTRFEGRAYGVDDLRYQIESIGFKLITHRGDVYFFQRS